MSDWDIREIYSKKFGKDFTKEFDRHKTRGTRSPEKAKIPDPDIELINFLNKFQRDSWNAIGRKGQILDPRPYVEKLKEIFRKEQYANTTKLHIHTGSGMADGPSNGSKYGSNHTNRNNHATRSDRGARKT